MRTYDVNSNSILLPISEASSVDACTSNVLTDPEVLETRVSLSEIVKYAGEFHFSLFLLLLFLLLF